MLRNLVKWKFIAMTFSIVILIYLTVFSSKSIQFSRRRDFAIWSNFSTDKLELPRARGHVPAVAKQRPGNGSQIVCNQAFDYRANGENRTRMRNPKRRTMIDPNSLNMSCSAIRTRNNFAIAATSPTEAVFPILFVRIVYQVCQLK